MASSSSSGPGNAGGEGKAHEDLEDLEIMMFKEDVVGTLMSASRLSTLALSERQTVCRTRHNLMRHLCDLPIIIQRSTQDAVDEDEEEESEEDAAAAAEEERQAPVIRNNIALVHQVLANAMRGVDTTRSPTSALHPNTMIAAIEEAIAASEWADLHLEDEDDDGIEDEMEDEEEEDEEEEIEDEITGEYNSELDSDMDLYWTRQDNDESPREL